MSAIDVLRQIKMARKAAGPQKVVEWGNADYIKEIGIENLSRRDLRNHLEARDLETNGTRVELIERLRNSITDEEQNKFAYTETLSTEELIEADLEQRGSVYVIGSNSKGQLGIGDLQPRTQFVCIKSLRGCHVNYVCAGVDMVFAVTDEHDVYVWGGGGVGRNAIIPRKKTALELAKEDSKGGIKKESWLEPQLVLDLAGEEVVSVVIGGSHCKALILILLHAFFAFKLQIIFPMNN